MLGVISKQQNTRRNRTYFSNDRNSLKMQGILRVRRLAHKSPSVEFATVTQHGDRGWNRTYVPAINRLLYQPLHYPPSPWKVVPHHRGRRPLLFTNSSLGSFTPHKNQNSCKTAGPTEFCPFRLAGGIPYRSSWINSFLFKFSKLNIGAI